MYISYLLVSRGSHTPDIRIFLLIPFLTPINLYLQFCHCDLIITNLPLFLLRFTYLLFCPYLGLGFPSILVYLQSWGCYKMQMMGWWGRKLQQLWWLMVDTGGEQGKGKRIREEEEMRSRKRWEMVRGRECCRRKNKKRKGNGLG